MSKQDEPHLRQEFIAAIEHGEGCGCYYCLGPRPGISPPPLEIEDERAERPCRRFVSWELRGREHGWGAIRHENGRVIDLGTYPDRETATAVVQYDRSVQLLNPLVLESQAVERNP